MTDRKYLPTFADLCDRLSIVLLKQVFIPEHREAYVTERELIEHDIDLLLEAPQKDPLTALDIRSLMIIMLANRYIWENEADVRAGRPDGDKRLRATHMVNGVRNRAKNMLANRIGDRVDLKVDCLAADLQDFFGENWDLFDG